MSRQVKVICAFCKKQFFRPIGRFNESKKFGWNQYCSKECLFKRLTKKKILFCERCGKQVYRSPHAISPHNYCSASCAIIVNNRNDPKRRPQHKTCQRCGKSFLKGTGNVRFCSMTCRGGTRPGYTKDDVLRIIKSKTNQLGRVPVRREIQGVINACQRLFGSWNKALVAAGFSPHRSDSQRMYKRIKTKAKDGHSCDSVSEAIIDNWLFSHQINHQRNACYPTTNHKADWSTCLNGKRIFIEYFGLANDSHRYDRAINWKKKLCKDNDISLIEIYPQNLYPKNCLMDKLKLLLCQGGETRTPDLRFPKPAS